jgi:hypothetical protein
VKVAVMAQWRAMMADQRLMEGKVDLTGQDQRTPQEDLRSRAFVRASSALSSVCAV